MNGRAAALLAGAVLAGVTGCGDGGDERATGPGKARRASPQLQEPREPAPLPPVAPYDPEDVERMPNAKRLAGRTVQQLLTYQPGAGAREIAARLGLDAARTAQVARAIRPAVASGRQSVAEVIYAQAAGITESSFAAMVVVRQLLQDQDGRRRSVTRTVDVRLRRSGGPWAVDTVASVGGRPVKRPAELSGAARRVVDGGNITLPDSARWDIYRGDIDPSLLAALAEIARDRQISVTVLRSGHPRNVWATSRASAHSRGLAADIYAIDGRLVVRQQQAGSAAYRLAGQLLAGGARQVGSPWDFDGVGRASFSDEVHRDHIHLEQQGVPEL